MAGSFYDQILQGLGKDASLPELNGGTRLTGGAGYDMPVSGLDEATKARLAAQRAADSAAVNASRAAAASPEAAAAAGVATDAAPAAAKGFGARVAPTLSKMAPLLRTTARVGAGAVAPALEAYDTAKVAMDPNSTGTDVATQAASGVGRAGAAFAGAGTGAAMTPFFPPLGAVVGGALGYFGADRAIKFGRSLLGSNPDDPVTANAPAPVAPAQRAGITLDQTLSPGESVVSPADAAAAKPAASAPPPDPAMDSIRSAMDFQPPQAPQTRLVPLGPARESGGFIQRTSGGTSIAGVPVDGQDTPGERIELPSGTTQSFGVRRPTLAENLEYQHERNAARADQRVRVEGAKLGVSLIGVGKRNAEEQKIHILGGLAAEHLRNNPGDVAGAAAIMSGKDIKESVGSVASPTGSTGIVTRKNTIVTMDANGKPVEQKIFDQPTEDDVSKMKANTKNADYKNSFIRRFGPDAYKTHIGGR